MTGYVRTDTTNNIADGNVISAADLDNEFNGVQAAFNSSTGHTHDGTASEGAPITKLGPVQDVTISTTVLGVKTTNTVDLGTSSLKFKDFYLAGNALIGGTLGVTSTATFTGAVIFNGNATIGDADTDTITQAASYVTGTQLKSAKTATNTLSLAAYDVDGTAYTNLITLTAANAPTLTLTSTGVGTINNMSIGATTASTGAFTTLSATASSLVNLGGTQPAVSGGTVLSLRNSASAGDASRLNIVGGNTGFSIIEFSDTDANQRGSVAYAHSTDTLTLIAAGSTIGTLTSTGLAVTGTFSSTLGATIQGLTVGLGAGAVATNTAVGVGAIAATATGTYATAIGYNALPVLTSGLYNTAVGGNALLVNQGGSSNSAFGLAALGDNISGNNNTAIGVNALRFNTASNNTAVGASAAVNNAAGTGNTAIGYTALQTNQTSSYNTAVGYQAGYTVTGANNTAIGNNAGSNGTTGTSAGDFNTSVGDTALNSISTGGYNTAVGGRSLYRVSSGNYNVAMGYQAGNTIATATAGTFIGTFAGLYATGADNTAVGYAALSVQTNPSSGAYNTAIGSGSLQANTTGANNVAVGYQAGYSNTTNNQSTLIGYQAGYSLVNGGNTCLGYNTGGSTSGVSYGLFVGYGAIASGATGQEMVICTTQSTVTGKGSNTGFISPNGGGVYQGDNSATWSITSDQRIKKNIVDNNTGLSVINQIQVRNFEYRLPEEITGLPQGQAVAKTGVQLGVIAQELQQILPECVKTESTGVMSVNADNLTWYLVNAIKELKAEVDSLKSQRNGA